MANLGRTGLGTKVSGRRWGSGVDPANRAADRLREIWNIQPNKIVKTSTNALAAAQTNPTVTQDDVLEWYDPSATGNSSTYTVNGFGFDTVAVVDPTNIAINLTPTFGVATWVTRLTNGSGTSRAASTLAATYTTPDDTATDKGGGIGFHMHLKTYSDLTTGEYCAGMQGDTPSLLGLSNGNTTTGLGVPDHGFWFWYNASISPNWLCVTNAGAGVDSYFDSKIPVRASTCYGLFAELNAARKPVFRINGQFVGMGPTALIASKKLVPVMGFKNYGVVTFGLDVLGKIQLYRDWKNG